MSSGSGLRYSAGSIGVDRDEPRSILLAAVGRFALSEKIALVTKVELFDWESQQTIGNASGNSSRGQKDTDWMAGFELDFRVHEHFAIRSEFERFFSDVAGDDHDLTSLNAIIYLR